MKHVSKSTEARELLLDLEKLLEEHQESNWIRGVRAALSALSNENGSVAEDGFANARSAYRSMTMGGRGFSEYYISNADGQRRQAANERLTELQEKLWRIFDA